MSTMEVDHQGIEVPDTEYIWTRSHLACSFGRLEGLPFPICWQVLCDCLTTREILSLGCTSRDSLRLVSPMIRELTLNDLPSASYNGFEAILRRCTRLERINGVNLGSRGVARLGRGFEMFPLSLQRLHTLNLSGNMICEAGLSHLLPGLGRTPRVRVLLLDSNSLGNGGIKALAREFQAGLCPHLKVLNLALNAIGSMGVLELAEAMQRSGVFQTLEVLNLDGNVLGPGTQALARAFKAGAGKNLRELHLRNNDVRGEGLRELLEAFCAGACSRLEVFNLDSNMFGSPGARLIGQAFIQGACAELQLLNLNATFIGVSGTRELRDVLQVCGHLKRPEFTVIWGRVYA